MAAKVITAMGGAVNGVECVSLWKTMNIAFPAEAICSASDGAVLRAAGIRDWQGFYQAFGHTPPHLPADIFTFEGAASNDKGAKSVADGAIVDKVTIEWNLEQGAFIRHTTEFACKKGILEYGSVATSDSSIPNPPTSTSCNIAGIAGCIELRRMKLILLARNPKYVNASTEGQRQREPGNKDGGFECTIYTEDADFELVEQIKNVTFEVGTAGSWDMKWAILSTVGATLPIGQEGLFEAQIAGKFTGYKDAEKGWVKAPGGTAWWD